MFEDTYDKTLALTTIVFDLLASLGLKVHPTKGHFLPILVGDHLGMTSDFEEREFRAPTEKLKDNASLSKGLICRATSHKRWVSVKALASLAGKAQFLHLAILVAGFFLGELHDFVKSEKSWSGTVKGHLPAKAGIGAVNASPQTPHRSPRREAHRERPHPLRLQQLRMGSGPQHMRCVSGFLVHAEPRGTHRLQGIEGGALRHQVLCIHAHGGTRCCCARFVISGCRIGTHVLVR